MGGVLWLFVVCVVAVVWPVAGTAEFPSEAKTRRDVESVGGEGSELWWQRGTSAGSRK